MQVTLETTQGLERKMRISVPSDQLETQVQAKLKQAAQQVRLKGFRPGKVPMREVQRRFGDGIRQEVSSELIQSSFSEAIQQESVAPAGTPQIEDVTFELGQDLAYTAVFEVFPEVEPGDFAMIEVEKPVAEVSEADIDNMIDRLRDQKVEYVEVPRGAQMDDQAIIDFEGFIDDEPFEGGQADGVDLILGSGTMIPGFETGIVGCEAGAEEDLKLSFPDDYHVEDLAGKAVLFKVVVNSISEPRKPELDEAFFVQFGVEEAGLEAFRAEIKGNMTKELDNAVKHKVKTQAMEGLLSATQVDIPKALFDAEVDRLRHEAVQQFGGNSNIDPSVLPAEMFEAQATKRVSLGLIINAVVEKSAIEADDERVKEAIEEMASSYDDPDQVVNYYYGNEQQLNQVRSMVIEEQVVELILGEASISDVEMSYEDAVKPVQQAPDEAAEDDQEQETGGSSESAEA